MKDGFCRFWRTVIRWLYKVINNHKGWIIAFAITFLVFFITGIMTAVNYLDVITYENIINKYMVEVLTNKSTYLSFFLMMLLWFLLISIFVIWFTKNIVLVVIDFILLSFLSYICGFDICIVVMTLGLAGVIYGVVVLGLLEVLVFLILIVVISVATKKFFSTKNYCDLELNKQYFWLFIIFILMALAVLFVMSVLFSTIRIFVIVD